MKDLVGKFAGAVLICALACTGAWAQATAEISGTVKDQTGAVLPGAEIKATQTDTGIERNTISNETGSYVLPNLALGPYRLEIALPGFRTFVQTGIVLQVNSSPVINAVLEVGQVSEQVEVQANAAMVETRSVGVGQVIENERILELPLNGRNAAELITLAGAAVQVDTTGNRSFAGQPIISAAGAVGFGASYALDGIAHMDPYDGQSQPLPFPDALEEFKVETSGLSAQNGRSASVSSVTKSGTNEFHGSLFEFVRNDLFNARNYFAARNSTLKRNQFGGTLGGPIAENKLFFFGGYQGTTIRQDPANIERFVPTAAMLAGDFTAFASPECNRGRQINLRAPYVNNRINPALFSKPALTIANQLPKTSDPCGRIIIGQPVRENDGQAVGKIDYQHSANHSLFGRYLFTFSKITHPYFIEPTLLNTDARGFNNLAQAYTFGDTYLIGPNTVNAFRLGVSRVNVQRVAPEFFEPRDIGIDVYSYVPKFMILNVSGGFNVGRGTGTPSTFRTTYYQAADDLSLIRGTHQMSFGGRLGYALSNTNANVTSPGSFSFNGQETGLGMADFFVGRPSSFSQRAPNILYVSQWYVGLYAQDTWKATPRLTVNYGIRWQPFLRQELTNGFVYNFDYERFRQGIRSTVFKNAPAGFYYPGDPGFPPGNSGFYPRWTDFGPRLGLAWDVHGDGRTSVRASYGMTFEDLPMQWRIFPVTSPPWGNTIDIPSPAGGLENPYQGVRGGNPFPAVFNADAPFIPYGDFQALPYRFKPLTVSSWNLSIQRQIAGDWLLSASYLGTQTLHVWTEKPFNPAIYFPGGPCTISGVTYNPCSTTRNTNQRRRLSLEKPADGQFIGNLGEYDLGGTQIYHGMLLSAQRRAARGVTIGGNYTWSHCIGDERRNNAGAGFGATETYLDPNNRRGDRGNCGADRRHVFNLTAVAETPEFASPTLRALATGWRLSGIYRRSTGGWLNITTGLDVALTGIANQRPNQVLANVYGAKTVTNYLNPAAFAQPAAGTAGNMGYASIEGPGNWTLDLALSRIFRFQETRRLEFRAEAYNFTNSLRMGNPGTNLNQLARFGQITTASDPRILQFALKYVF